jgi:hypothetical protein
VLVVLGAVADYALPGSLPTETRLHRLERSEAAPRDASLLLTALWIAVAVGTVLAWVGLLYLVREARGLYLASWMGYVTLTLLRGPVVESALGSALSMLTALVGGGILGVVYFSELRSRFRPFTDVVREAAAPGPGTGAGGEKPQ